MAEKGTEAGHGGMGVISENMDKGKMRIRIQVLRKIRVFSFITLVPVFVLMMAGCGGFVDGPDGPILDTEQPTVISTDPVDKASGVALDSTISVTFSEPMEFNTFLPSSFLVELKPPTSPVVGSFALSGDGTIVTFTPDSLLSSLSDYTVTLLPDITDLAGNALVVDPPLDNEFKWDFTTGLL